MERHSHTQNTPVVECDVCFKWPWQTTNLNIIIEPSQDNLDQSVHDVSCNTVSTLLEESIKSKEPVKFDWEENYFKKFDWLDENTERYIIAEHLANYIDHLDIQLNQDGEEPLFLYFISLQNCKMFLYHCHEKAYEEVLAECESKYEYVQINRPLKVVFVLPNIQQYEIDENVKLFMHQFGIDNTRGGSYTTVDLSDETKEMLCKEFLENSTDDGYSKDS